jgi:thiamine transport system ATP-binding protein
MAYLEWRNVVKSFGAAAALSGVNLTMERGETVALLGPSGCGKTTLLRVTAGLEVPEGGRVLLEGGDLDGLPPHRRGMGLMFQDYLLFPHLDVEGNVGFGLRMQGVPAERRRGRIREILGIVRMSGFEKRSVSELSGGEKQRVALARSLAPSPALLMLDEPLGALDAVLRDELMNEIPGILRRAGATVLYVTHDQEEAMAVADRVALMNAGEIVQTGRPMELMKNPANAFAASFLKLGALVPASVSAATLNTALGGFPAGEYKRLHGDIEATGGGFLLVRPAAVKFGPDSRRPPAVSARIAGFVPHPGGVTLRLALLGNGGEVFELSVDWNDGVRAHAPPPPLGSDVKVGIELEQTLFIMP